MALTPLVEVVDSILGNPFITVHVAGVVIAIGAVMVTDALTLVVEFRPKVMQLVVFLSPFLSMLIWVGFLLLAVSGSLLVVQTPAFLSNPIFRQKMLLVSVLFLNGLALNEVLFPRLEEYVENDVYEFPRQFELIAAVSAVVSMVAWWGTLYISYYRL